MGYDAEIGIVGAGPAGARAAELLARAGADVACWDPRAPWEKPCGGGLSAGALRMVPELAGVAPLGQTIRTARLEAGESEVEVSLARPLVIVARRDLARWQMERARAAGVRMEAGRVRQVERLRKGGWRVLLEGGDEWRVRLLVGADGAASRVRAEVSPGLRLALEPTRVAYVPSPGSDALTLRFLPGVEGYAWIFPRPGHCSVGMVAAGAGWNRALLDEQVDRLCGAVPALETGGARRAGAVIGSALHPRSATDSGVGGDDFALLGDAAGFADPASGEGICNALRSAEFVAEAYRADGSFRYYSRIAMGRLEPEFRAARIQRRLMYGVGLAGWLTRRAGRSRLAYALGAALLDGINEHEPGWIGRWWRGYRRAPARR